MVGTTSAFFDGLQHDEGKTYFDWDEASKGFMSGVISGAITGMLGEAFSGMSIASRIAGNSLANALSYTIDGLIRNNEMSLVGLVAAASAGAIGGIPSSQSVFLRTTIRSAFTSAALDVSEKTIDEIYEYFKSLKDKISCYN